MKISRLSKKRDFSRLFKAGQRCRGKHFSAVIISSDKEMIRAAIIIKSSLVPKATKRNYWRRRVREILRIEIENINHSCDLALIMTRIPESSNTFLQLKIEVQTLLNSLGLK